MTRRRAIEQMLHDWFRREGWDVGDGIALFTVYDEDDDKVGDAPVNIYRLADEIEREISSMGAK